jgi:hypothetical protein
VSNLTGNASVTNEWLTIGNASRTNE